MIMENRQERRRRTTIVNIQITFISWSMELLSGLCLIIVRFYSTNKLLKEWLMFADVCFNFIIIPSTYILNNEVTKRVIVIENWYEGIRNFLNLRGDAEEDVQPRNGVPGSAQQNRANQPPSGSPPPQQRRQADDVVLEDIEEEEATDPAE